MSIEALSQMFWHLSSYPDNLAGEVLDAVPVYDMILRPAHHEGMAPEKIPDGYGVIAIGHGSFAP